MKKRKKDALFAYISGDEIKDFDLEELENDWEFMKLVINHTNDKKMYNFCSDDVKNEYQFVLFLVEKFSNDLDFIIPIVDEFFKNNRNNDDKIECFELAIIISSLAIKDERIDRYRALANVFYMTHEIQLQYVLRESENQKFKDEVGNGFLVSKDVYLSSKIIKDFVATKAIYNIFYPKNNSFEELIHKDFKNKQDLENTPINNYLINYINMFDKYLANYVAVNIYLLDDIKNDIKRIIKYWDFYVQRINNDKIEMFLDEINEYVEKNDLFMNYSDIQLIYYVVRKLNVENIFNCNHSYNYMIETFEIFGEDDLELDINNLDEKGIEGIEYALNFAKKLFKDNYLDRTPDDYVEKIIDIRKLRKEFGNNN